jgi:hypothetical protein
MCAKIFRDKYRTSCNKLNAVLRYSTIVLNVYVLVTYILAVPIFCIAGLRLRYGLRLLRWI